MINIDDLIHEAFVSNFNAGLGDKTKEQQLIFDMFEKLSLCRTLYDEFYIEHKVVCKKVVKADPCTCDLENILKIIKGKKS